MQETNDTVNCNDSNIKNNISTPKAKLCVFQLQNMKSLK